MSGSPETPEMPKILLLGYTALRRSVRAADGAGLENQ
jgi:hypothetical protein